MYGVKLVRLVNEKYCPLTIMGNYSGMKYPVGVEVFPPDRCGPLAVFNSIGSAMHYYDTEPYCKQGIHLAYVSYSPSRYNDLWVSYIPPCLFGMEYNKFPGELLPRGTVLADSLTVLSVCKIEKAPTSTYDMFVLIQITPNK